jgi:hypothetical protein
MSITQSEYDFLMGQKKVFDDSSLPIEFGPAPIHWTRQVNSLSSKDIFLIDFRRGSIEISKYTVNKRYRQTIIMLRYDNGGRHTNPDGTKFEGAHVHLYKEGFDDKFAYPISTVGIEETDSIETVFTKIMYFCNISKFPTIEIPMF